MAIKDIIMVSWENTMAKKRKLNSTNPKYQKEEKTKQYKRILYKELKRCKIYLLHEIL